MYCYPIINYFSPQKNDLSKLMIFIHIINLSFILSERAIASKFQIQAKECKIDREGDAGVCMFNYECYKKQGTVLGTCIDGFLFGACCKLPKNENTISTHANDDDSEHEENIKNESEVSSSDEKISSSSSKPDNNIEDTLGFLSDSLSKSDLDSDTFIDTNEDDTDVVSSSSTEASQEENSFLLDSIEVPLEIDNKIPSIILGNGSVVSLESLSIKPDLFLNPESSTSSEDQSNNNQLFTWFTIDQLFNSTTESTTLSSTSVSSSSLSSTSTLTESSLSTASSTIKSGSTQDLPFLDDLFSFDDQFLTSKTSTSSSSTTTTSTTTTTTSSPSTTTTTTTSTTTSTSTSTTTKKTTTTSTTTTSTTTTKTTSTTKSTTTTLPSKITAHPVYPDPFLDLATEELGTLRYKFL